MNTLIILNGPKQSGKDTLCDYAEHFLCYSIYRPIDVVIDHLGKTILPGLTQRTYCSREYREYYETPVGKSLRAVFISYSEDFLKPMYGRDYIGRLTADKIREELNENTITFAVVQAMGDVDEIRPIVELPWNNIILVRIHRKGCSFEGDSRKYFNNHEVDADWIVDLVNDTPTEHSFCIKFYNEVINKYCKRGEG